MDYTIRIDMNDLADGDVTGLAQEIWDKYADDFDAKRGDFVITALKGNFALDWEPEDFNE